MYQTKGAKHTENAKQMQEQITDAYCDDKRNVEKTVQSVISKHMNEITNGMSIPKDQAVFCLGGGLLKRSEIGSTMKCSISMIPVEDLHVALGPKDAARNTKAFNWSNIVRGYSKQPPTLEEENIFRWCMYHFKPGKKNVPQFLGYNNKNPKWPLDEKYAKYTLALFKPWRGVMKKGEIEALC